jgi:hypothetical protein
VEVYFHTHICSRTHKMYFVIACISRVTDLLLQFCRVLMLYYTLNNLLHGLSPSICMKITLCVSTTGSVSHPEVTTLIIFYDRVHPVMHIINQWQFVFTLRTVYCIQQCSTMLHVTVHTIIFRHKCWNLQKIVNFTITIMLEY